MSTTRRAALRGASLAGLLGIPAIATAGPQGNPDAELILVCHQFAEDEFESFYRYTVLDELADQDWPESEMETYHWIVARPATTPEGWRAKALAYAAWDRPAYDDDPDARDLDTTFLASLLRDMVRPARNAIIARCAAKYGPLPPHYTADSVWIGYTDEQLEANRANYPDPPPGPQPEHKFNVRPFEEMTREELEGLVPYLEKLRENLNAQHRKIVALLSRDNG